MKVTFKVIDTRNGKDITNDYCWVLRPDGRLCYNAYGDLIGMTYAQLVLNLEERIDVGDNVVCSGGWKESTT